LQFSKGESTTLIDKDERARKKSGEKIKLAKKKECIVHRVRIL